MNVTKKFRTLLISSNRNLKVFLNILSDVFCINFNFAMSYFIYEIIYKGDISLYKNNFPVFSLLTSFSLIEVFFLTFLSLFVIFISNGYKSFFRSSNVINLLGTQRIIGLMTFTILIFILQYTKTDYIDSIKIALDQLLFITFYLLIFRSIVFKFLSGESSLNSTPLVIYGAGQSGRETAAYLSQNEKYRIVGFIDDNANLKNYTILGYRVLGGAKKIKNLKLENPNLLVVMAISNISSTLRKDIISNLEKFEVNVKTIPSNYGSLESKLTVENIDIFDLIDRKIVKPKASLLNKDISNKVVLVTGAGGSIGSEISTLIANLNPIKMIFIDFSEFNLYKLKQELKSFKNFKKMDFILEDIKNINRINVILEKEKVGTIYHAAAYKHVPLLQSKANFFTAIKNNFIATFELCNLASNNHVEKFILISSDKAVNPPNIMGATKRLAELALQAFQDIKTNKTIFSMVRFGNVLNSSGSVVPLFWDQIYSGGPVTVTHEEINRYFMSINEAASLVIQAGALSEGGEVYLLDMGDPIKIKDLAEKMIRLSGNSVSEDEESSGISISYTGLRPGEKIFEELLLNDNFIDTEHESIKKGIEKKFSFEEIKSIKNYIEESKNHEDYKTVINMISKYVDGFKIDI